MKRKLFKHHPNLSLWTFWVQNNTLCTNFERLLLSKIYINIFTSTNLYLGDWIKRVLVPSGKTSGEGMNPWN